MYIEVKDIVDEGIEDQSDTRIEASILLAQKYIELITGQWFESKSMTLKLDSDGSNVLFLPVFAYSVSEIRVDGGVVYPVDYTLYNRFFPDDRYNPKIIFDYSQEYGSQIIEIDGEFGYVESNGATPELIKKACKKLTLHEIGLMSDVSRTDYFDRSRIIEEDTDGHSYKLGDIAANAQLTGDSEIDNILKLFQSPLKVGAV